MTIGPSPGELAQMLRDNVQAMPDTATILRATAVNGPGGQSRGVPAVVGTTPCRLSASVLGSGNEQDAAAQLAGIMTYTLTVPPGTDITHNDQIQVGDTVFEVAAGKRAASWNMSDSWTLTEIQR